MSSLFSNLNNTQTSNYGGLFGNSTTTPATTTAPPTLGGSTLFGNSLGTGFGINTTTQGQQPAQTTTTAGGMFGGAFGAGSTTQPAASSTTGGLFGSATQPAASTNTSGLFGSNTQQQPASNLGGGIGLGLSQTAEQSGLGASTFGASQAQSGQNNAYFDTILERSRKRAHVEDGGDDLPQLQLGLGDLRQRIKRLGGGNGNVTPDPNAHYLLAASGVDPGAAVRDLNSFSSATGRVERAQPVENPDVDVESYLANLQTQTTLSMIADGLARSVRDFDAFLEENVSMEWDAQRKRIYQHFGIRPKEAASTGRRGSFAAAPGETGGFGTSRRRTKAAVLGTSRAGNRESSFGGSMNKSVIGAGGPVGAGHQPLFADVEKKMEASGLNPVGPHDRFQRDKQSKLAEKIQNLNHCRISKQPYPICRELSQVVEQSNDQHREDLVKAYRALAEIVGENSETQMFGENNTAKEREFAPKYLDETVNSPKVTEVRKAIIRGGSRILEKLAMENIEEMVQKNQRDAALGGIPTILSKVKAYVRLQASKRNLLEGGENEDMQLLGDDYCWALVYHLLRTGHVVEARQYVDANSAAFRAIDRNFGGYIRAYAESAERTLDQDSQARINNEYNQRLRIAPENSIDPYRMACYKIIGRCDLAKRALDGVSQTVEDFVWLQLVLARELNRVDSMASEVYDLTRAQETIRNIGNRYWAKGGAPELGRSFGAFVFMQVSMGMFEDAVSYLYTYSYIDGVHLAIALDFYGLLRVTDPNAGVEDLTSLTTKGQSQINFGIMVGLYTRDFRAANVTAAVDYLTLICLNQDLPGQGGRNQISLCHEALRELVLESREFTVLLGDMRDDGQRIKGAIELRMKLIGLDAADDFMRTITMQAASVADDNGRVTDAVLLYHLAGEFDNVMITINRSVSEAVAVPLGQERMKITPVKARPDVETSQQARQDTSSSLASVDDPVELAHKMHGLYSQNDMYRSHIKAANLTACDLLLKMAAAKSLVENGQWDEALGVILNTNILPLNAQGNASDIRSKANTFSSFPQPVAHNVPNLLLWAILCCNNIRSRMASTQFSANDATRQQMIDQMKQMNMDLTTYTSQLRYRFPEHIIEALARAQSD